jgi:predicted PurR-regulated permease PerM
MDDRTVNVSITVGTVFKTVLVGLLVVFLYTISDIVLDVFTAIVIASAMEPAVVGLRRHKVPRVAAVILVYLILLSIFFTIIFFFLPTVLGDILTLASSLPLYISQLSAVTSLDQYTHVLGLPSLSNFSAGSMISAVQGALGGDTLSTSYGAVSKIFGGLLSFIIIIVFSFYFAVLETGVDDFLRIIVPRAHQPYILGLWRRSQHKIGLWMQGQLVLALIMGVLVFMGLSILKVPHALVLALIAACFEIIPVFGPTLSAVPAVALAFASGGATLGLLTIGLYVVAQQLENHLIYPLVVTRVVGVPPLLVILALIIGAKLAGFLGIILSVPIAATIQELVKDIERNRLTIGE